MPKRWHQWKCELLFSSIKVTKSKLRTKLNYDYLQDVMVLVSSNLTLNHNKLSSQNNKNPILIQLSIPSEWRWLNAYYLSNSSYIFSLHQSGASSFHKPILLMFFQPVSSILSLAGPVYVFYPLHLLLPSSKHFLRLSQNMIIPPHNICPCQLICCFLQSQHVHQLLCIPLVHQLHTVYHPHHRSFCSFQNSYFIFSQTPCFAST